MICADPPAPLQQRSKIKRNCRCSRWTGVVLDRIKMMNHRHPPRKQHRRLHHQSLLQIQRRQKGRRRRSRASWTTCSTTRSKKTIKAYLNALHICKQQFDSPDLSAWKSAFFLFLEMSVEGFFPPHRFRSEALPFLKNSALWLTANPIQRELCGAQVKNGSSPTNSNSSARQRSETQ